MVVKPKGVCEGLRPELVEQSSTRSSEACRGTKGSELVGLRPTSLAVAEQLATQRDRRSRTKDELHEVFKK